MAVSELALGNTQQAFSLIDKGIALHKGESDFHYRLAAFHYRFNLIQEALAQFQQGLTLDFEEHATFFDIVPDALADVRFVALINNTNTK
jgi:tetratricopeptide (TPR) repeat protein